MSDVSPNSLYTLVDEHAQLISMLHECEEVDSQILENIGLLEADIKKKAISIANFIRRLGQDQDAIDAEIERLKEREARLSRKEQRLRDYLKTSMQSVSLDKIETDLFDIRLRKCPVSVHIEDPAVIGEEFMSTTFTTRPNKALIRQALESGFPVPGAEFRTNINLEIK